MMNVKEYASDVVRSVDEILKLCKKLGIEATEDTELSEDEIVLLDNELVNIEEEEPVNEEFMEKVELEDKAEELAQEARWMQSSEKPKKKAKQPVKNENNKKFLKEKKSLYKHREKLMTNDSQSDVVYYKSGMTVSDLAHSLNVTSTELIKKLIGLGIMATLNNAIEYDVAEVLVLDYGKTLKKEETADIANFEEYEIVDDEKDLIKRPPVVTIMGHVDHGKTSLLDYIRKTNVAGGEAGGITQAIGAYQITYHGEKITFIDTPGHEAFTAMRARGAQVTDIVVIIVAADDGVMPQTKEAIDHAKAAGVPILVAINKMDKPGANPDRVLTQLNEAGLVPESWGGDTIVTNISAVTGMGVDELLDNILLVAEMKELKANPKRYATGTVLESKLDKQTGSIVTILIDNGTLRLGDPVVVGTSYGKIRTMKNDLGQQIAEALTATPVEITGLDSLPTAGDKFMAFETEKQARSISEERKERAKSKDTNRTGLSLDELFGKIQDGAKELAIVLKADVTGSEQAVKQSLEKIKVDDIHVNIIRSGVGTITESDVVLAKASNAIIIGFNVRPSAATVAAAKEAGVEIRLYNIIYKVVEELEDAMKGMLEPEYEEKVDGEAEIRKIFKFSKIGNIAGCKVTKGVVKNHDKARLVRDGIVIYDGSIASIQHEKDQVKEVKKDMECGITLENYQDIKEGDIIEAYQLVEIKR